MSALRRVLVAACCAGLVSAQERLEVAGPEPATISLGDTAEVQIRIVDPQGDPKQLELPKVDGLRLRLAGPSQMSNLSIVNGRRVQTVSLAWTVELQPMREGSFVVPSFPVWTGSKEQKTRELRLDVRKSLDGGELVWIEAHVERQRVYVHEPVRVRLDGGVQPGLRVVQGRASSGHGYYDVEFEAPWLEDFPGGERIELPQPSGPTALIVKGGNSLIPVQQDPDREHGGARWLAFTLERAFLPTRPGTIELDAPALRCHVVVRQGQRDIFGLSTGGMTKQLRAYGKPLAIEVLPIPEAGRPTPYYGAVGRFTIDASIDRDTVKVASSVKLTLTVRGSGNLEFLRLPTLDDLAGLHKLGQAEARRDAEKVVITYDLTPLSTDVREIPAIGWNFFDTTPGVEKFVTVATKALPLQVLALADGETLAPLVDTKAKAVTPGVDDIFDLPGLGGTPVVVRRAWAWWPWACLLAPWGVVLALAGWFARQRRRRADVTGQRARQAARTCEQALANGADALDALAGYLGDRIGVPAAAIIAPDLRERLVAAGLDAAFAAELAGHVDQGTAARYGGGTALPSATVRELVRRLEAQPLRLLRAAPLGLLLAFVLGGAANAQQPAATPAAVDPVAAYRAGDYRAAEAAFAQQFAATGDRRLLQARGNCFYRLDDLPRALWAFESARLALPRDAELLANVALVRRKLGLDDDADGLLAQLERVRTALTTGEQLGLVGGFSLAAALCLVLGWRRTGLRWIGGLAMVPSLWLGIAAIAVGPGRDATAIALQKIALVSEPRPGLEPVATVRPGVAVAVLGGSEGAFVRVRAGDRIGFAPKEQLAVVE